MSIDDQFQKFVCFRLPGTVYCFNLGTLVHFAPWDQIICKQLPMNYGNVSISMKLLLRSEAVPYLGKGNAPHYVLSLSKQVLHISKHCTGRS
jgi:hypothetical protein